MKVRCVVDDELSLTKGKIYEVVDQEHGLWAVVDDEDEVVYLYSPQCFEVVEEEQQQLRGVKESGVLL